MNEREMIERRCAEEGFRVEEWDEEHENGLTAKIGGRFEVNTDLYEDEGLYCNDVGVLTACVVGAEQYRNQRVSFSLIPDGYDEGTEVEDLTALDHA